MLFALVIRSYFIYSFLFLEAQDTTLLAHLYMIVW